MQLQMKNCQVNVIVNSNINSNSKIKYDAHALKVI